MLAARRALSILPLIALCLICAAGVNADPLSVTIVGEPDDHALIGTALTANLSAVVNNAPTTTEECTVSEPEWEWSVSGAAQAPR